MSKIELELDTLTLEKARILAEANHANLADFLKQIIERLAILQTEANPVLGLCADIPEIIDEIVAEAMLNRGREVESLD